MSTESASFTVSTCHSGRDVWHDEDRGPMKEIQKVARWTGPQTYQSLYECTKCERRALFGLSADMRIVYEEVKETH